MAFSAVWFKDGLKTMMVHLSRYRHLSARRKLRACLLGHPQYDLMADVLQFGLETGYRHILSAPS
jgi:hypothetical protein